jgi:hypothetical protein
MIALLAGACGLAAAQTQPDAAKPKHVWTNDELENLKGGINVVGDQTPMPSGKAKPGRPAEDEAVGDSCDSDEWSHAVAAVLEAQGAMMSSKFWATRLFNNLCSSGIQLDAVSRRVAGDYTLDDGTKIHLKTGLMLRNLPQAAELVASVNERRPFIVARKGHAYVLTSVNYVDNVYDGISRYTISKLYLTNALTGRPTLLEPTADNMKEIDGTLQITVSPRQ